MSKFLGVNISDEEQQTLQNKIIPKLMKSSEKLVPDGADILHELIMGYDSDLATKKRIESQDIAETIMYSNIKKALGHSIPNDTRSLVDKMRSKYQWNHKMISCIFTFCAAKNKGYDNYISKVAENWFNDGVKTYDDMIEKTAKKN